MSKPKEDERNLDIQNTKYWKIILSPEQYYFGRCVVILKRECGELSKLTDEEFLDLLEIIKKFETVMKKEFGATMFNWTCLMNNAYKETNNETPQVHFHVRPRYKNKVEFAENTFKDEEFAHHYERKIEKEISREALQKIVEKMKGLMK